MSSFLEAKPAPVLTKMDFTSRFYRGEFGNRPPTWLTLAEFQASGYNQGKIHIRNRVAGGPTWYDIEPKEVKTKWIELVHSGVSPSSLYISAMCPHHMGTIQGEIMQNEEHLHLAYCSAKQPMREAMKQVQTAKGVSAVLLLKRYMNEDSYEWMNYLLDTYIGHVLEFTCFERPWGVIPRRNTVWWECRLYQLLGFVLSLSLLTQGNC